MKRFHENFLFRWFNKNKRKPLIIRGARQVGKSTLVRNFANSQNLRLFEVNIEQNTYLESIAESLNPSKLITEIEFICNKGKVNATDSLIFFDEIQGSPKLLQCLRYFFEDYPEIPVISAGSLLEFTLSEKSFPMPVGRIEFFYMGPVSWEEFLTAKEEFQLLELLNTYHLTESFPISAHLRLIGLLREYLLVGGMPEAVQSYIDDEPWSDIIDIQNSIIETYKEDFSKYARGNQLLRLQHIIDYMGQGTGKKVKYVNIDRNSQAREIRQALDLLLKAGIIFQSIHTHANGIPLAAESETKIAKLFNLDIGLYHRLTRLNHIKEQDLLDARFINEGVIAEQFIAQHLYFYQTPKLKPELFYWLREGNSNNAEIDFLIQSYDKVIPIEVKSGKSGSLKSILQFNLDKKTTHACRFDLNLPSFTHYNHKLNQQNVELDLLSLPLYLCGQINRLTEKVFEK